MRLGDRVADWVSGGRLSAQRRTNAALLQALTQDDVATARHSLGAVLSMFSGPDGNGVCTARVPASVVGYWRAKHQLLSRPDPDVAQAGNLAG